MGLQQPPGVAGLCLLLLVVVEDAVEAEVTIVVAVDSRRGEVIATRGGWKEELQLAGVRCGGGPVTWSSQEGCGKHRSSIAFWLRLALLACGDFLWM